MGDFARKTAHLTLVERGAYDSMLDHYYATETSLPSDSSALHRICGAMSPAERKAVEKVANEFFPVNGDGTRHNKRADEEIRKYCSQEHDDEHRKESERERQRRHRERRKQMFDALRERGITPTFDATTDELQRLLNGDSNATVTSPVTPPVTSLVTRDTTANQIPEAITQKEQRSKTPASPRGVWDEARTVLEEAGMSLESARGWVAKCLKEWPEDTVRDAILEARGTNDPKGYATAILKGKAKKKADVDYTANAK